MDLPYYSQRIKSYSDPSATSLSVLRELNCRVHTAGDLVNQIYTWSVANGFITLEYIKCFDPFLLEQLQRGHKRWDENRHSLLAGGISRNWGGNWGTTLHFRRLPGKSILITLQPLSDRLSFYDVLRKALALQASSTSSKPVSRYMRTRHPGRPTGPQLGAILDELESEDAAGEMVEAEPTSSSGADDGEHDRDEEPSVTAEDESEMDIDGHELEVDSEVEVNSELEFGDSEPEATTNPTATRITSKPLAYDRMGRRRYSSGSSILWQRLAGTSRALERRRSWSPTWRSWCGLAQRTMMS